MPFLKFFLMSLFVLSVFSDDRVQIDMYTEALCPDCIQFITTSFKTAFQTKDFDLIANLNLYPYGNAHQSQSGTQWAFTCQHGANECFGNLMENCVFHLSGKQIGFEFAICLEENIRQYSQDFTKTGAYCAQQLGVNMDDVTGCMQGDVGNKIQHDVADQTESLFPAHQYVPWIVVNNKHDSATENLVMDDLLGYVCKNYKGTVKIDACA